MPRATGFARVGDAGNGLTPVAGVTASAPILSSGGANPVISRNPAFTLTSITYDPAQHASAAGSVLQVTGQQGAAGFIGGEVRIASGLPGTAGSTERAGAITFDLGRQAAGSSATLRVLNNTGGADIALLQINATGAGSLVTAAPANTLEVAGTQAVITSTSSTVVVNATTGLDLRSGTSSVTWRGAGAAVARTDTITPTGAVTYQWAVGVTSVTHDQVDSAGATGATHIYRAQNAVTTGGAIELQSGNGATIGTIRLRVAGASGTVRLSANGTGLGLFATAPVAQPARAGQLTDNSGGASGGNTIAAIVGAVDPTSATVVSTANAVATIAARLNLLEGKISGAGTGIGVTA